MAEKTHETRTEKLLLQAGRIFNSTLEYEELIQLVLNMVMTAVDAEAALVYRSDEGRSDMPIRFTKKPDCEPLFIRSQERAGFVGWVAEHQESVIINDAANDPRLDDELQQSLGIKIRSVLSLPLIGRGQVVGVVEAINKSGGEFSQEDLDILTGLNNQIAVAIDNAHLYREMKREALERALLYDTGKILSEKLKLDEVLRAILETLKKAVDYDAGGVFLTDDAGVGIQSICSVGYDPGTDASLQLKYGQGIIGTVAATGEPVIVPDVKKDPRYVEASPSTRSEIVVPILIDDRVIGVINLESDEVNAYNGRDISLISAFASQAAISLERAKLHENILAAKKLEEQLNIAREIQRTFLPDEDPQVEGYQITGRNVSSGQVGGDYYDFIKIVDQRLGISVADVSGKGMPAALIMASLRASLIAEIRNNYTIRTIAEKVNSLLCESLEPGNFVTGIYCVLDSKHHMMTYSNFGHNPPLLLQEDGEFNQLTEGGPVLGVSNGVTFEEGAISLRRGEVLVMYTDGVTEVFNDEGVEFGAEGLMDVIRANRDRSASEIADAIYGATKSFAPQTHVYDDITMVVVKRLND